MTNEQLVLCIRAGENTAANMAMLYEQNWGIIAKLANKYQHHAEFEDLMQEGYIGLCNAVNAWKADEGVPFLSYAVFWIKQSMYRYIENNGSSIRIPVYQCGHIRKYKQLQQQYLKILGREPEEWELCRLMGVSKGVLEQIIKDSHLASIGSLDKCVGEDEETPLYELVPDKNDAFEGVLDEMQHEELKAVIWPMVDSLEGQQPEVIRMRYQEEKTLKETGEALGIGLERARILQAAALKKLGLRKYSDVLRTFLYDEEIRHKGIQGTGTNNFRRTWTSATERVALNMYDRLLP